MPLTFSILFATVLVLLRPFINFEPKLEDALSAFDTFSKSIDFSTGIHEFSTNIGGCLLAFSILLVNVLIFVEAFMNFKPKLEDAFSVFNTVCKSINFSKGIH